MNSEENYSGKLCVFIRGINFARQKLNYILDLHPLYRHLFIPYVENVVDKPAEIQTTLSD
jgi:hypothetical protein